MNKWNKMDKLPRIGRKVLVKLRGGYKLVAYREPVSHCWIAEGPDFNLDISDEVVAWIALP